MRILFVGDLSLYSRTYRRYLVFKKMFRLVDSLSTELNYTPGLDTKKNYLFRIFFKLGFIIDENGINKKLINAVKKNIYDLIWFEKTNQVNFTTLKKIKKYSKARLVYYTNDNINLFHNISLNFLLSKKLYDYFVIIDEYSNKFKKNINSNKILNIIRGYDDEYIFDKIKKNHFKYKVVFIGSFESFRSDYINFLSNNGIRIDVFGNGWKKVKSNKYLNIHNRPLYHNEYLDVLHNSYLVLNFFRKKNFDQTTSRTFEIPASGTLMITERSAPSINYFEENLEAIYFSSKEELLKKVKYCLNNKEYRMLIIKNAISKIKKSNYSYSNIISSVLKRIK